MRAMEKQINDVKDSMYASLSKQVRQQWFRMCCSLAPVVSFAAEVRQPVSLPCLSQPHASPAAIGLTNCAG